MALWSVYEPPGVAPRSFEAIDRAVMVRDGWSWGALLLAPLWLLWRRMWLVFLGWLAMMVLIEGVALLMPARDTAAAVLAAVFGLWFALEANALRRWTLARKGWRFAGFAAGADRMEAEQRFFTAPERAPQARPAPEAKPSVLPAARQGEGVIGLFPQPGDGAR